MSAFLPVWLYAYLFVTALRRSLLLYDIYFTAVCNNFLLTGRNISTTATSVFGLTDPKYIYDPAKILLNSKEETDGQGHTKIGSWTAGVNDKNQYLQVNS